MKERADSLQISLRPEIRAYLRDMVVMGAFGSNEHEVAAALIESGVRRAVASKMVALRLFAEPESDEQRETV